MTKKLTGVSPVLNFREATLSRIHADEKKFAKIRKRYVQKLRKRSIQDKCLYEKCLAPLLVSQSLDFYKSNNYLSVSVLLQSILCPKYE